MKIKGLRKLQNVAIWSSNPVSAALKPCKIYHITYLWFRSFFPFVCIRLWWFNTIVCGCWGIWDDLCNNWAWCQGYVASITANAWLHKVAIIRNSYLAVACKLCLAGVGAVCWKIWKGKIFTLCVDNIILESNPIATCLYNFVGCSQNC